MNAKQFSFALGKVDDKYIMESAAYQRKKKTGWRKWGMMAACFCLLLTAAAILPGVLKGPGGVLPPTGPAAAGPVTDENDRQPGTDEPKSPQVIIEWDKVAVNESTGMISDAAPRYYDPKLYHTEDWGEKEIAAYYGWNLEPGYIPEGLTDGGKGPGGIMYQERATGKIVQDQGGRGFWTDFWEDGSPKSNDDLYIPTGFTVQASKLGILRCALLPVDEERTTDFGGVPVTLTHCSMKHGPFDPTQKAPDGLSNMPAGYYDIYTAFFTLSGTKYEVTAQRLELEEVVQIAASVIGGQAGESITVGDAQ